ncbi:hypothetical protein MD588_03955 [Photobacterium sp. SDRW27]|uniref:hypothetical protein n=1 Tax=Photobacterium obscurum TaxID=2829490 RepID=UPI002243885B|nr:hypothetical protein [Photobacterium obscurum]MCW8327952.1 hypothetical protein [Photobacterium obscurum]
MKVAILSVGVVLQCIALYIAFYSSISGNIYLATLISVAAICCLITIRSIFAPVCLLAGILVGLSLSHNEADLQLLTQLEKNIQAAVRADFIKAPEGDWGSSGELKYSVVVDDALAAESQISAPESVIVVQQK